ncbi:acyl-homoserine-lactone synthase [Pseudomonas syringae]|uniref:Acyl-homoserine-lactone synthase n=1 Tax=Pseudomonas viridiflava ICMP 13104 TaxID=1198305 RepID=A0A0W0IF53_PSEVI|nr:acyl-homoserine-lactone synthase [Pseudomonas viridiflava ICMP 13104]
MTIAIDARSNFDSVRLQKMHALRAKVFRDKKEWDVSVICGMEIDGYDALNPYYMILQDTDREESVSGCWRLLPTTGPNMLADTFPELLAGSPAPCADDTWELSRFAICQQSGRPYGFSDQSLIAIRAVVHFGVQRGLKRFVTVTTVGVEKLLIRLGLDIQRLGPAQTVGVERAVALSIALNRKTLDALAEEEDQPYLSN